MLEASQFHKVSGGFWKQTPKTPSVREELLGVLSSDHGLCSDHLNGGKCSALNPNNLGFHKQNVDRKWRCSTYIGYYWIQSGWDERRDAQKLTYWTWHAFVDIDGYSAFSLEYQSDPMDNRDQRDQNKKMMLRIMDTTKMSQSAGPFEGLHEWGTPIAGWFLSRKIPSINGWWLGVPLF